MEEGCLESGVLGCEGVGAGGAGWEPGLYECASVQSSVSG
jgi:hypothetical protein